MVPFVRVKAASEAFLAVARVGGELSYAITTNDFTSDISTPQNKPDKQFYKNDVSCGPTMIGIARRDSGLGAVADR